jgi:hypothetical protein
MRIGTCSDGHSHDATTIRETAEIRKLPERSCRRMFPRSTKNLRGCPPQGDNLRGDLPGLMPPGWQCRKELLRERSRFAYR